MTDVFLRIVTYRARGDNSDIERPFTSRNRACDDRLPQPNGLAAVNAEPLVQEDPPSLVFFDGFGDSSLNFRVLFWIENYEEGLPAKSAVGIAIERALSRENIVIPFPQRDIHVRSSLPGQDEGSPASSS